MKTSELDRCMSFFAKCLIKLKQYNVNIRLTTKPRIFLDYDKTWVKGAWDDSDKKNLLFDCSIYGNVDEWFPVFIHEYCHFLQWIDRPKIWYKYQRMNGEDLNKIVNNLPISKKTLNSCLNITRDLELDCEKRTVNLIRKHNLPIDVKRYIKNANIYVHYYNYLKICRKWHKPGNEPYLNPKLLKVISSTFYKNYDTIPPKLLNVFLSEYPPAKNIQ